MTIEIEMITLTSFYVKIKALLEEKEREEYIVNHRIARNILIENLNELENILKI